MSKELTKNYRSVYLRLKPRIPLTAHPADDASGAVLVADVDKRLSAASVNGD